MSLFSKHRVAGAIAGTVLTVALSAEAFAAPMGLPSNHGFSAPAQISNVRYAPRNVARGGNGGAVAAAALGIMALGIGAAIASSRHEQEYYPAYVDPGYGYGYAPAPVYSRQPLYYEHAPRRFHNEGNYWQRKARDERDGH